MLPWRSLRSSPSAKLFCMIIGEQGCKISGLVESHLAAIGLEEIGLEDGSDLTGGGGAFLLGLGGVLVLVASPVSLEMLSRSKGFPGGFPSEWLVSLSAVTPFVIGSFFFSRFSGKGSDGLSPDGVRLFGLGFT